MRFKEKITNKLHQQSWQDSQLVATVSPMRLRLGLLLIVLWWLPAWLLAPLLTEVLGYSVDSKASYNVFLVIIGVQTALGVAGIFIAGREIIGIVRHTSRRKFLKVAWNAILHGKFGDS